MVVDTAAGKPPVLTEKEDHVSAVRFIMDENDLRLLEEIKEKYPRYLKKVVLEEECGHTQIVDSGTRPGFFILQTDTPEKMEKVLHHGPWENPVEILRLLCRSCVFIEKEPGIIFI